MSFIDQRFPEVYAYSAIASDEWLTEVVENLARVEARNSPTANPRRAWDLSTTGRNQAQREELQEWFLAMRGQLHSFAFKDPGDNAVARQSIGTGDAVTTQFQIYKTYSIGSATYNRDITKPVTSTVSVWINNVAQPSGWSVSRTTGIITFSSPPGYALSVEVAVTEFDVPVRFGQSRLAWSAVDRGSVAAGLYWVCSELSLLEVINE